MRLPPPDPRPVTKDEYEYEMRRTERFLAVALVVYAAATGLAIIGAALWA